jgi:hypothetical protein
MAMAVRLALADLPDASVWSLSHCPEEILHFGKWVEALASSSKFGTDVEVDIGRTPFARTVLLLKQDL